MATPFLVPDEWTLRALEQAAGRGVALRILVPIKDDVAPVRWIAQRIHARLLRQGVRVFGYRPCLLHPKALSFDGGWFEMVWLRPESVRKNGIKYQ